MIQLKALKDILDKRTLALDNKLKTSKAVEKLFFNYKKQGLLLDNPQTQHIFTIKLNRHQEKHDQTE
jgi:hypothetical protein